MKPEKTVHPLVLVILLTVFLVAIITVNLIIIFTAPERKLAQAKNAYSETSVDSDELDEDGYFVDNSESRPTRNVISSSENVETGISLYDSLIENAISDAEKSGYYLDRAAELYSTDKTAYADQILADAYAAEELHGTAYTAAQIAYYEVMLGSKETAEKYYCIAYERDPGYAYNLCAEKSEDGKEQWEI